MAWGQGTQQVDPRMQQMQQMGQRQMPMGNWQDNFRGPSSQPMQGSGGFGPPAAMDPAMQQRMQQQRQSWGGDAGNMQRMNAFASQMMPGDNIQASRAAGFDVGAWQSLSPQQQAQYTASGGGPSQYGPPQTDPTGMGLLAAGGVQSGNQNRSGTVGAAGAAGAPVIGGRGPSNQPVPTSYTDTTNPTGSPNMSLYLDSQYPGAVGSQPPPTTGGGGSPYGPAGSYGGGADLSYLYSLLGSLNSPTAQPDAWSPWTTPAGMSADVSPIDIAGINLSTATQNSNNTNFNANLQHTKNMDSGNLALEIEKFKEQVHLGNISEDQFNRQFAAQGIQFKDTLDFQKTQFAGTMKLGEGNLALGQLTQADRNKIDTGYLGLAGEKQTYDIGMGGKEFDLKSQGQGFDQGMKTKDYDLRAQNQGFTQDFQNRELGQTADLTREGHKSNELQSRYSAFGRAQAPGAASFSKNWG